MILQLGSLFKKQLMYFINYLFTYAKSVSTTMLFLLMPYCWALFEISCGEYMNQFGLKNKANWKIQNMYPSKTIRQIIGKEYFKNIVFNLCIDDIL